VNKPKANSGGSYPQFDRAGIPGFAWRSAKNKPKKFFALRAKNTKKNKKNKNTPKKHQKNTKIFFRAYARKKPAKTSKNTHKKIFALTREK